MKRLLFLLFAFLLIAWSSTDSKRDGRPFVVMMSGAQEAPGPGDPDGTGVAFFWLNQGQGTIEYEYSVENISTTYTGAHIHRAPAGSPGPVVIPLATPMNGSTSVSGSVMVDPELIKEIRKNPEAFYVNIHNTVFPAGAVRGQLSK